MIEIPVSGEILFRSREEILAELQEQMQLLIPDVYLGEDGNLNMVFQVLAGVAESIFLSNQIVSEDMFPITANPDALEKWGDNFGVPRKVGTKATGTVRFEGEGATSIPVGAEVAHDTGTGEDPLYFLITTGGVIPSPGIPTAPVLTDLVTAGNLTGTFEYIITFMTAEGETLAGAESAPLTVAASKIRLTVIPLGGPGTISRRIYRQKNNSGVYQLVATIADNTTVQYDDNIADGSLGGNPPTTSTAERLTLPAQAESEGEIYNVLPGAITIVVDVPDGVAGATNTGTFLGGTDPEEVEDYRQRLLRAIRSPETGSVEDIRGWAEEIDGVESATVYSNDNNGVATNGHTTVRISGPGGTVPGSPVITAVLDALNAKDIANITIHVGTFTPVSTAVSVTVTPDTGFVLADVTTSVQLAISDYINQLAVGETLRIAGIVTAVFGLPGIVDVVVTSPGSNQATGSTSKRTPGTITVS